MGYPTIGIEGELTSFGSANFNSVMLAAMKPSGCTLNVAGDVVDVTALTDTIQANTPGLKAWTIQTDAFALATPAIGANGLITLSSGYALHCYGWTVNIAPVAVHDITEFSASPPVQWRSYMPDYNRWSGTLEFGIDSATALTMPPNPAGSLPTLTMKMDGTATLAGSVLLNTNSIRVVRGNPNRATVSFTGSGLLTPAGATNPLGTTAADLSRFLWSAGGSATGAVVMTASTGRTYSGADSFVSSVGIACAVGAPVTMQVGIQGCGVLTVA